MGLGEAMAEDHRQETLDLLILLDDHYCFCYFVLCIPPGKALMTQLG